MVEPAAARPQTAAAHVVVDDLEVPALDDETDHHLRRVLRLRADSAVTVTDGQGRWRPCVLHDGGFEAVGAIAVVERPSPTLTVGIALAKGTKPDDAVRRLAELGIDRIVPFVADRSVVRWDDAAAARRVERLRAIARSAIEQSRRCWRPEVTDVSTFAAVVAQGDDSLALADPGGAAPRAAWTTVLVGPEGGWSDEERAAVEHRVAIADGVLRAETAAITAGVILAAGRQGLLVSP